MESRIQELERRSAFQEKLLSELNDVILEQGKRLEVLEAQVRRLKDAAHNEDLVKPLSEESRPPHY